MWKNLVDSGFYLGDISVMDNVHWVQDGRADRLAVKLATTTDGDGANPDGAQKYPSPSQRTVLILLHSVLSCRFVAKISGWHLTRGTANHPRFGGTLQASSLLAQWRNPTCSQCEVTLKML